VRRSLLRRSPRHLTLVGLALAATIVLAACVPASPPPPPGHYVGLGFDTCGAPSVADMQAWTLSPYHSIGIYIGGQNAACPPGNTLTASWVSQVSHQGWFMAPIYVGLQSPCNGNFLEMSGNVYTAYTQGTQAADSAITDASVLGFGAGTPIYYDMEGYNCGGWGTPGTDAVMNYVAGWVSELHARGYLAGFYSSDSSGIANQVTNVDLGEFFHPVPDDIWFAAWPGEGETVSDSSIPSVYWVNQRLHQFEGGHNETWGGVTLNVDLNYDDGQLAG